MAELTRNADRQQNKRQKYDRQTGQKSKPERDEVKLSLPNCDLIRMQTRNNRVQHHDHKTNRSNTATLRHYGRFQLWSFFMSKSPFKYEKQSRFKAANVEVEKKRLNPKLALLKVLTPPKLSHHKSQ